MEPIPPLSETLRRLDAVIREHGLNRSDFFDPERLAAKTALSEDSIRLLLDGRTPPDDTVNARVCARVKAVADAYMARTGMRRSELATELSLRASISEVWARQICDGKKTPNVELLHHLVGFFGVDGGETFFTASADQALNRVLLPLLEQWENPERDPVQALLDRYGVKSTDLRLHGTMTRDGLERLLEGVLRSVLPQEGDGKQ
ncbi:hypothetical protein J7F01_14935 [Streptomyces sp. ISL-22]|uniref:hypothetical protein n=1 Tax=unclassified Streptomyces TaxID=2593676 RepID=UPI001BE6F55B|nr:MULTISPECIES: hypothetical protein [unclassified Streptomyces]MBT2421918.1 hypothetical protein [Streptomyces sp. ISL-24]MBT2433468.1 hypothetical protein [Streptomyces sp. ISL-22]